MTQTLKIFLACALGAFVGALVALQVNHNFWWVGLIAGFAVGYLTYEFKNFVTAIPAAWREARGWRPDKAWWKAYYERTIDCGNFLSICMLPLFAGFSFIDHVGGKSFRCYLLVAAALPCSYFCSLLVVVVSPPGDRASLDSLDTPNPFRFYLWLVPKFLLWMVPRWVFRITLRIPAGVKAAYLFGVHAAITIRQFAWHLFRLTHSELRLLCGFDAAIGAAIGYAYGSAIIGALIGGLWGVANFEIFSVRVLKFIPRTESLFHR